MFRRTTTTLVLFAFALSGSACVRVQPYDRALLATRVMSPNPDPSEVKTDSHVHEYREGSSGATGAIAGGCGCN